MFNEQGHSLPESLLTLVILLLIFGTLLPFYYHLETSLYKKKLSLHAAEAAFYVAGNIKKFQKYEGQVIIDGVKFYWEGDEHQICIQYAGIQEESLCIHSDS
ncbi:hypothetical protein [Rummeliibacillus pycnus]|uniref:hypothetical protein n=1 Tax=Rummeliibacillus pycnus TaxID=101070 RepID=UPI000C9B6E5E|nr:hypothetical protein [Rummeliibacillus pycnus]